MKNIAFLNAALVCLIAGMDFTKEEFDTKMKSPDFSKEFVEIMNKGFKPYNDVVNGNGTVDAEFKEYAEKVFPTTFPNPLVAGGSFQVGNQLADTNFALAFDVVDARGNDQVAVPNWTNAMSFNEYATGQPVTMQSIGFQNASIINYKRWSCGINLDRTFFNLNGGRVTMAQLSQTFRTRALEKRAAFGYDLISATAGVTTESFATSILNTINVGASELLDANKAAGKSVTTNTILYLYAHPVHKAGVMAAINSILGQSNNNTILEWNVVPVFSFDLPKQYGGTNGGMLVLPGMGNVWANFRDLSVENQAVIVNDAWQYVAVEGYNGIMDAGQKRIIEFV